MGEEVAIGGCAMENHQVRCELVVSGTVWPPSEVAGWRACEETQAQRGVSAVDGWASGGDGQWKDVAWDVVMAPSEVAEGRSEYV